MKNPPHPKSPSTESNLPAQSLRTRFRLIRMSFLLLLLLVGGGWGLFQYYNRPLVTTTDNPAFTEGQYHFGSLTENLEKMEQEGVIRSARFARLLCQVMGYDTRIPKGIYHFTNTLSTLAILDLLIRGQEASYLFTLVEGFDIYDIDRELYAQKLITNKGDFIRYSHSKVVLEALARTLSLPPQFKLISSEGFLYPNTYRLRISRTEADLTQLALEQFQNTIVSFLNQNSIPQEKWLSFMTMSSLIEKETFKLDEKKLIASVLYNRLNADMRLRYDPTIIYALKKAGLYEENLNEEGVVNIRKSHFTFRSPYNTYTIKGLPRTPISSFTLSSLEAVLYPAKSEYLFFVARSRADHSLGHDFSKTYEEHLAKIQRYRRSQSYKSLQ